MQNTRYKKKMDKVSDIPAPQIKQMQKFAQQIKHQHPSWTVEMIGKKVAEKFNIKLKF